jgi:hypothetical protein
MTIDAATGEINWPSPSGGPHTITFGVTDAANTNIETTWTLTVTQTGNRFIASNGNDAWDGTAPAFVSGTTGPWRTLNQAHDTLTAGQHLYFVGGGPYLLAGAYTPEPVIATTVTTAGFAATGSDFEIVYATDMPDLAGYAFGFTLGVLNNTVHIVETNATGWQVIGGRGRIHVHANMGAAPANGDPLFISRPGEVTFNASTRSVVFIADPDGVQPIIDNGYVALDSAWGANMFMFGNRTQPTWMSGIKIRNAFHKGVELISEASSYNYVDLDFEGTAFGVDGANSANLMTASVFGEYSWHSYYRLRSAPNAGNRAGMFKIYGHKRNLVETISLGETYGSDHKAQDPDFEVRFSKIMGATGHPQGLGGNFAAGLMGERAGGEIRYSLLYVDDPSAAQDALELNNDGEMGSTFVTRCTLVGRVVVENSEAGDGPFTFRNNVIVNNSTAADRITVQGSVPGHVTRAGNLSGGTADGIVDATGRLTGASRTSQLGRAGYELPGVFE